MERHYSYNEYGQRELVREIEHDYSSKVVQLQQQLDAEREKVNETEGRLSEKIGETYALARDKAEALTALAMTRLELSQLQAQLAQRDEQLQLSCRQVKAVDAERMELLDELTRLRDLVGELEKDLRYIAEYWNGHANQRAMEDACNQARDVANAALLRIATQAAT